MLRAHRGRAYRVEPDWNVTKANDDRLHADDCGIAAECLRIFNFRLTNPWGIPANGAAPRGWSCNAFHVIGPGRGECAGHPVNPSLGARWRHPWRQRSRAPTPTDPDSFRARPATEKKKEDQKQKQLGWPLFVEPSPRSAAFRPVREAERRLGSTQASAARDPLLLFFISSVAGRARNLSAAGWVGVAGYPRHGSGACARRVGQDAQPRSCRVRRTAHTSKRRPSLHGRTCSSPAPGPTPPSHGLHAFDVDVASAGAGLQALQ